MAQIPQWLNELYLADNKAWTDVKSAVLIRQQTKDAMDSGMQAWLESLPDIPDPEPIPPIDPDPPPDPYNDYGCPDDIDLTDWTFVADTGAGRPKNVEPFLAGKTMKEFRFHGKAPGAHTDRGISSGQPKVYCDGLTVQDAVVENYNKWGARFKGVRKNVTFRRCTFQKGNVEREALGADRLLVPDRMVSVPGLAFAVAAAGLSEHQRQRPRRDSRSRR
jgi:hypothetical protein